MRDELEYIPDLSSVTPARSARGKASIFLRLLSSLIILSAALTAAYTIATPALTGMAVRHALAQQGFTTLQSFSGKSSDDSIVFKDIKLDPEGFSSIGTLAVQNDAPFLPGRDFKAVALDGIVLTGEVDDSGAIGFSGWAPSFSSGLPPTRNLVLKNARLDLDTAIGALRFNTGGSIERTENGLVKFEGAASGTQQQLMLDARWRGQQTPDGRWTLEGDLAEARLNTGPFSASRVSGWLSLNGLKNKTPSVAGQFSIGHFERALLKITNATLTLDGPLDDLHVLFKGDSGRYMDMKITAEATRTRGSITVSADVETTSAQDLLHFLHDLRQSLENSSRGKDAIALLMITPGNIGRLANLLSSRIYDRLDLKISGPPDNLNGRIIVRRLKDGKMEHDIIALNPGRTE